MVAASRARGQAVECKAFCRILEVPDLIDLIYLVALFIKKGREGREAPEPQPQCRGSQQE
jgi:hypothetical protein